MPSPLDGALIVAGLFMAAALVLYRAIVSPREKSRRKLDQTPRTRAGELSVGIVRVAGLARRLGQTLQAPVSGRSCLAFELVVEAYQGRLIVVCRDPRRRLPRTGVRPHEHPQRRLTMATIMQMHWAEVTKEQYEAARKEVNWEGNRAPGGKFHVSWFAKDGLHVLDLWESPQDFQRFVETRLAPVTAKLGIKTQPKVEFAESHAIFAPDV